MAISHYYYTLDLENGNKFVFVRGVNSLDQPSEIDYISSTDYRIPKIFVISVVDYQGIDNIVFIPDSIIKKKIQRESWRGCEEKIDKDIIIELLGNELPGTLIVLDCESFETKIKLDKDGNTIEEN